MRKRLEEIADIRLGIFYNSTPSGNIRYLQAIDYNNEGQLHLATKTTPMVSMEKSLEKHLLQAGDILFSAKGDNHYSIVFQPGDSPCIASTSFIVITIRDHEKIRILPEYVCWYMNNPDAMKLLKISSKGTNIHSVSKAEIKKLEILIPPLQKQELIAQIDFLLKKEQLIQNRLNLLKKQLLINSINQ